MATKKKQAPAPAPAPIVSYKGFNGDWKCRDFQYEVGGTYHHDGEVKACNSGFHACEYPLDVFNYYSPAGSKFAMVEQSGDLSRHGDDSKVASKTISIKLEIDIPFLVKAAIEYTTSRCLPIDPSSSASATGYQGAASATGDQGAASATGYQGAASATGDQGAASATGDQGVACGLGYLSKAMAIESGAIVLVHRNDDYEIVHIRASKVGENGIEPNTWYSLDENGEFIKVED